MNVPKLFLIPSLFFACLAPTFAQPATLEPKTFQPITSTITCGDQTVTLNGVLSQRTMINLSEGGALLVSIQLKQRLSGQAEPDGTTYRAFVKDTLRIQTTPGLDTKVTSRMTARLISQGGAPNCSVDTLLEHTVTPEGNVTTVILGLTQ
jgi:hypothetical protein